MSDKLYHIDDLFWEVDQYGVVQGFPICVKHRFPLDDGFDYDTSHDHIYSLHCTMCGKDYGFPRLRSLKEQENHIYKLFQSKKYKQMDIIDLDGELTPVAKAKDKNSDYFATAQIMESKRGPQLVIYAGKKGQSEKTQIFITPETKKMSFDHKDISPTDIFTKVTAEFSDGTVSELRDTLEQHE